MLCLIRYNIVCIKILRPVQSLAFSVITYDIQRYYHLIFNIILYYFNLNYVEFLLHSFLYRPSMFSGTQLNLIKG